MASTRSIVAVSGIVIAIGLAIILGVMFMEPEPEFPATTCPPNCVGIEETIFFDVDCPTGYVELDVELEVPIFPDDPVCFNPITGDELHCGDEFTNTELMAEDVDCSISVIIP